MPRKTQLIFYTFLLKFMKNNNQMHVQSFKTTLTEFLHYLLSKRNEANRIPIICKNLYDEK